MATPKRPDYRVALIDENGKTSLAWYNYWSDVQNQDGSGSISGNPTGLIGMSAVNGVATTLTRTDGRHAIDPAIAPDWTGIHDWMQGASTVLSLNPTSGGVAKVLKLLPLNNYQGITVNQTVSGLSAAWAGSSFEVTDATTYQNFGPLNSRINVTAGWGSQKVGLSTSVEIIGASATTPGLYDVVGHVNNTYATGSVSPTYDAGRTVTMFGFNHLCWTGPGGTNVHNLIGGEIDVSCHASAPSQGRIALFIASTTNPWDGSAGVQGLAGVGFDVGLALGRMPTAPAWGHGIRAHSIAGAYPFDTNSTYLGSAAGTCGWGIDFQHITFTQYAFLSPGFSVDPDGDVVVKSINSTSGIFKSNGTQVLQGRDTGWSLMAGTATKGGFNSATVTLQQLAQVVAGMIISDFGHGLKGA